MKIKFALIMILTLLLAACSGTAANQTSTTITQPTVEAEPQAQTTPEAETQAEPAAPQTEAQAQTQEQAPAAAAVERPAWQSIALTDARTGESFTLADFAGKTVFVEPMATWCTNCRSQLTSVRSAREQLSNDDFVFIALSLEIGLASSDLAAYAQRQGFDWTFAVMPQELLQALTAEFGRAVASAPSTPHFIIRPDGTFTGLSTGQDSPAQLVAELTRESGA